MTNQRSAILCAAMRLALFAMGAFGSAAQAQDDSGFRSFVAELARDAANQGVSRATIDAVVPTLQLNQRVIQLDRAQPGSDPNAPIPDFAPYKARHVDRQRVARGRSAYQEQRARLMRIERETGVPESIMVAIWGHETNYGAVTGAFDLPQALATLAYEGRRRTLFSAEFISALKIVDSGVPRGKLVGSWAGAMGGPQFLPSVYLRLARDGDGDGKADIWSSPADTLASIASYFSNAGWRSGEPWGLAVSVPASLDRTRLGAGTVSPRCPKVFARHSKWRTIGEWRALGVVPQSKSWPADTVQATLLEPDGPGKTAYLLTGNYRVILDYNCSNFYALSVGLLADAVEN